ncbi:FecCD family ABC transporter permease [Clostridium tetani]|uniref:Iron ABC transporter permease n=1 Tax=Clostridium tetani TaxID=1513 RepID=A0A4Q0VA85_CLOTA|nr:iron ABC transporter permease [Clostridium tetani]CDI49478.1 iron ABC transporter permease [Clostridium tetani 12124569]KHO39248.1 iron ABC transporter permease [Clostridium tetani]RXI37677.1 iron ABC transporter permease [Clostridium tetani]RXI44716.1 iron ABC transporter permease [Clostridium tetani]RXI51674.1 iron ABC transporter permease [Clostridium tetani]
METIDKARSKHVFLLMFLLILSFFAFAFCVGFGSVKISLKEVIQIIFNRELSNSTNKDIIMDIRLPRAIATLVGGAALALSGLLLQIFFKNPIVEPYILGISSGATLFVALVMLGGFSLGFENPSPYVLVFGAFLGSLLVMMLVVVFAMRVKNIITLLIIGIMVGYICSAVTNILTAFADKEQLYGFIMWTKGSFSGFTWNNVGVLTSVGIPILIASFFTVKPLNAFLMGEEYAKSMGVNIKKFRLIIILIASILTAVVTAFTGPIAFIGLAVPHISRLIFKTSDNRVLIPGTVILGAIVTAFCDLICRTLFAPIELPISAITSFIGAPIVIYLILKRRASL